MANSQHQIGRAVAYASDAPSVDADSGKKQIVLALAGGNALGAYAAGAYEALHEREYAPDLISGASIGAITFYDGRCGRTQP